MRGRRLLLISLNTYLINARVEISAQLFNASKVVREGNAVKKKSTSGVLKLIYDIPKTDLREIKIVAGTCKKWRLAFSEGRHYCHGKER